jgi:hypothetical protein
MSSFPARYQQFVSGGLQLWRRHFAGAQMSLLRRNIGSQLS